MQKNGPFYLISGLLLILFFIVGVRYGQRVEKTNKNISAILSTTPKQAPPGESKIDYKTYKNDFCALKFSYPDYLKLSKETTSSAEFKSKNNSVLNFSCDKKTGSKINIITSQE